MADRCAPSRLLNELGLEYEVPNLLHHLDANEQIAQRAIV
jgi:hypothetical protein